MNYYNYFTEIEEAFVRRRGRHLSLSPLDWSLIESWQKRGVPLRLVLRGINTVFDSVGKDPIRLKGIKSLSYCKNEIESIYRDWLASNVGKQETQDYDSVARKGATGDHTSAPGLFAENDVKFHLESIIRELNSARPYKTELVDKTLAKIVSELEGISDLNADVFEKLLNTLDSEIDMSLIESLDDESRNENRTQVEKDLAKHKPKMDTEGYQTTFELMLFRRVRKESRIPRLSLFDL